VLDQHLMIVALTANASEEDRARYLACGMDAFLAKPIDEALLHVHVRRAIERQLQRGFVLPLMPAPASGPAAAPAGEDSATAPSTAPSTADLDAMFGVFTGPPSLSVAAARNVGRRASDLKGRMRGAFQADLPRRRAELDAALADGDLDAAGRLLHGMRGSAGYLDEGALYQLCGELERAADAGRLQQLREGMPHLLELLARVEETTA
jgi:HPt (histidine-containing phosphotransfer) domain-containing protein